VPLINSIHFVAATPALIPVSTPYLRTHKAGQAERCGQEKQATTAWATALISEHQSMMVLEQAPAILETDSHKAGQVKLRRSGKGNSKKSKKRAITVGATAQIRSPLETRESTMVQVPVLVIQEASSKTKISPRVVEPLSATSR
jgi:primosomal replication protein N